jgi:ABC-type nitrate/sulfonate/bicarbonate transport system substrate-binding protein
MPRRALLAVLLALAALTVAGCGATGAPSESRPDQDATLLLDFAPNAVHAGIYLAQQRGYDDAEGVHLRVEPPAAATDGIKALLGGQADLAIVDVHDLAIAREKGRDVVGVMAIVQTPLAAVLAQPDVARPRGLEGRRVGVTGLPSDDAVLRAIISGDGGNPARVRRVTIGFTAVQALLTRKVDAATAFWNAEGVALQAKRRDARIFRVDEFGAPAYPELVLATSRESLDTNGPVIRAAIRALRRGYEATIDDPESAITALVDAEPSLKRDLVARELDAVSPSFTAGARRFGELDPARLRAWAAWEQRFGIVRRRPDVARAFDPAISLTGTSTDPNG